MAVKSSPEAKASSGVEEVAAMASSSRALVPVYLASLVLLFIGERVVSSEGVRWAFSGLGVAGAIGATLARFAGARRGDPERRAAEKTLAMCALGGVIAIALYFTTTETMRGVLGVAKAAPATRARVEGATTVAWVTLMIVSLIPLVLGELALAPMRSAERIEARRVRAAIRTGLTVAFAAAYCALFTYATGELDVKADFSFFRTARPSEPTRNIAASASEPIKVMAFFPEVNEVGTEVQGYLRDLSGASPNFKIEVHDRLLDPVLAKESKVTQDGVLVLTRGNSRETLNIGSEMKTAASKLKSLDGDFQKALLKVMREARVAYLTVGHGELNEATGAAATEGRSAKGIKKLLETQNYTVKDLGLAQGLGNDVPADATIVAVMGPSQALLPEEIAALKRYADRGGHLLLALDPDAKVDHAPLAAAVGLTWQPTVLANEKNYLRHAHNDSDRSILITNRYSSHASVSTLSRASARAALVLVRASSLDKRDGADGKIDFTVKSLPDTFNDANGNFQFDKDGEKKTAYNLAAAVSKPVPGGTAGPKDKNAPEMRAFVVADADAMSDALFGNEPNLVFVADVIRWLGGEESFSGLIATTEDVRIQHTKEKDAIWFYATGIGAPGLVLGLGLLVNRRARRSAAKGPRRAARDEKQEEGQ